MRAHAPALAALLLLPALAALPAPGAHAWEEPVGWVPGRNDYRIPVSDGAVLDATMYVPPGTPQDAELPAIVVIHGYGGRKDTGGARAAMERGYVGFAYSTRGFGQSTGQMDVVGEDSVRDLKEMVAWLKAHGPVHPDKVGVTGASYGGAHSFLIAAEPDAGVAAVVPIVGWTDLNQAIRPHGVTKLSYTAGFYVGGHGLVQDGNQPVDLEVLGFDVGRRQLYDTYDLYVHAGFVAMLTGVGDGALEQSLRERSVRYSVEHVRVPIYVIQGFNDDLFPVDQVVPFFDLIPHQDKAMYLGYVGHPRASGSGPEVGFLYGRVYAFFDHYLKGIGPKPFDPAAPIEVGNRPWDGTTLKLARWPATGGGQPYALHADGALRASEPATGLGVIANTLAAGIGDDPMLGVYVDQALGTPEATPVDTVVFRSAPLQRATELLGTPRAELQVRSTGLDYQVAVKLFDVDPATGAAELVTRGIYAVHDNVPLTPQRLLVDLQPYRHTFRAGHVVELRVAASDFPLYLPEKDPFTVLLGYGPGGSRLLLPLDAPLP